MKAVLHLRVRSVHNSLIDVNSVSHFVLHRLSRCCLKGESVRPFCSYISLKCSLTPCTSHMHGSKKIHALSPTPISQTLQRYFPSNHTVKSHSWLCFLLVESLFFSVPLNFWIEAEKRGIREAGWWWWWWWENWTVVERKLSWDNEGQAHILV